MSVTNSRKPWHVSKACALVGILYRRKKTIISIVCYIYIVQIRMFCFAQRFILTKLEYDVDLQKCGFNKV